MKDNTWVAILFLLFVIFLFSTSCSDGPTPIAHTITENTRLELIFLPYPGDCEPVGDGIWAENEGNKVDIYNNDLCDHGPPPLADYCDNVREQEACWVGTTQFSIQGTGPNMILYKVEF